MSICSRLHFCIIRFWPFSLSRWQRGRPTAAAAINPLDSASSIVVYRRICRLSQFLVIRRHSFRCLFLQDTHGVGLAMTAAPRRCLCMSVPILRAVLSPIFDSHYQSILLFLLNYYLPLPNTYRCLQYVLFLRYICIYQNLYKFPNIYFPSCLCAATSKLLAIWLNGTVPSELSVLVLVEGGAGFHFYYFPAFGR